MPEPPVVNTTPLIVLARIGRMFLLQAAGERIIVPAAVAAEVRVRGAADPAVQRLTESRWLEVVEAIPIPPRITALRLDPGEAAVLAWAVSHPGSEAILDDLRARRAAAALGVLRRGTLSLVLDAKDIGLVRAARPVIEELRHAGLYLSDRVMNEALARVGE